MRLALLVPVVLLVGCATMAADRRIGADAGLAKELGGLKPGKPLECLPIGSRHYTSTAYGPALIYGVTRGLLYVNRTTGGCEDVAQGDTLTSVPYQDRGCSGDTVYTLNPVTHRATGSCTLGNFVPYTR